MMQNTMSNNQDSKKVDTFTISVVILVEVLAISSSKQAVSTSKNFSSDVTTTFVKQPSCYLLK